MNICILLIPINIKKRQILFLTICLCLLSACSTKETSSNSDSEENIEINKDLIPAGGNLIFCENWEEFVAATGKAAPGDVIRLKNGTYAGKIKFSQTGTEAKPITIIPESRGKVIINGDSEWEIDGQHITVDGFYFSKGISAHPISFSGNSSHCRLINCAVVGWNLDGEDTRLINIRGTDNEVGYCVLRKKNTPGMMLEVLRESAMRDDHHIHHVYFSYFKDPGSGNGYETVRIGTSGQSLSSSYTTLENCVFERCDGEWEIISSKSGHNAFRNNTFLNSDGALTLRHGHDALVEGNFFINTLDRTSSRCNGVRVIGERQTIRNNYFANLPVNSLAIQVQYGNQVSHALTKYDQVKDAVIENNTIYNCDRGIELGSAKRPDDDPPRILPPNGVFRNNLIVSDKGTDLSLELEEEVLSDELFTYTNNIVVGKDKMQPDQENLPEVVRYMSALDMELRSNGVYYPADDQVNAGMQNKEAKPLQPNDIVPVWVRLKIQANDPDFTDVPW